MNDPHAEYDAPLSIYILLHAIRAESSNDMHVIAWWSQQINFLPLMNDELKHYRCDIDLTLELFEKIF